MAQSASRAGGGQVSGMYFSKLALAFPFVAALQHRDFRFYWSGNLTSVIGQQMALVVQAWLIFDLTGSALQLGLLGLARAAPSVALGLIGGVIADKVDRRRLLVVTISLLGLLYVLFATITILEVVRVWHILTIVFLIGAVQSFQQASRQAIFATLIDREHMLSAVGLNSMIHPGARIFAPVIAGLLIDHLGIPLIGAGIVLYVVAGCTFTYSYLVFRTQPRPIEHSQGAGGVRDLADGVQYVFRHPVFGLLIGTSLANAFLAGSHVVLIPLFVERLLGDATGSGIAYLYAAGGIGGLAGSIVGGSLGGVRRKKPLLMATSAAFGASVIVFAVSPWYALSLLIEWTASITNELFGVTSLGTLHTLVPDQYRGRVMGIWGMTYTVAQPLGSMEVGAVASSRLGASLAVAIGGALVFLWAILGLGRSRSLRDLPPTGGPAVAPGASTGSGVTVGGPPAR